MIARRVLTLVALLAVTPGARAETAVMTPPAAVAAHEPGHRAVAVFAGGCFWGVEAVFSHVRGVRSAVSGFAGGTAANPTYYRVSSGETGHAEAVRVTYDPALVRYDELLRVFFAVIADPTTRNRQGPDAGTQYRSALFPAGPEQTRAAAGYLAQLKALDLWHRPIVTRIEPARGFYPAEAEHQDFALRHPDHPYIRRWDAPKVEALRRLFPALWQERFVPG